MKNVIVGIIIGASLLFSLQTVRVWVVNEKQIAEEALSVSAIKFFCGVSSAKFKTNLMWHDEEWRFVALTQCSEYLETPLR